MTTAPSLSSSSSSAAAESFNLDDWVVTKDVIDHSLTCSICLHLLRQPVNLSTCSHTFCLSCLREYVNTTTATPSCSQCRTPLSPALVSALLLAPSAADSLLLHGACNEQLRKLKVYCPHCRRWNGVLGDAIGHHKECDKVKVACKRCGESFIRSTIWAHERRECGEIEIKCGWCDERVKMNAVWDHAKANPVSHYNSLARRANDLTDRVNTLEMQLVHVLMTTKSTRPCMQCHTILSFEQWSVNPHYGPRCAECERKHMRGE